MQYKVPWVQIGSVMFCQYMYLYNIMIPIFRFYQILSMAELNQVLIWMQVNNCWNFLHKRRNCDKWMDLFYISNTAEWRKKTTRVLAGTVKPASHPWDQTIVFCETCLTSLGPDYCILWNLPHILGTRLLYSG